MTTMQLKTGPATVLYVDSNAGGANDGSTPANALATLPLSSAWAANTVYLVRRTSAALTFSGYGVAGLALHNFGIIVMPNAADAWYDVVPTEAKTAWDADSSSAKPSFNLDFNTSATLWFSACTGLVLVGVRLVVFMTAGQNPAVGAITFGSCNLIEIRGCEIRDSDWVTNSVAGTPAALTALGGTGGFEFGTCRNVIVIDTLIEKTTKQAQTATREPALRFGGCSGVLVSAVDIHYVFRRTTASTFGVVDFQTSTGVIVDDLYVRYIERRDGTETQAQAWAPALYVRTTTDFRLSNIVVRALKVGASAPSAGTFVAYAGTIGGATIHISDTITADQLQQGACILENVDIDHTGLTGAMGGVAVSDGVGATAARAAHARGVVRNISFTTPANVNGFGVGNAAKPIGFLVGSVCNQFYDNIAAHYTGASSEGIAFRVGLVSAILMPVTFAADVYSSGIKLNNCVATGPIELWNCRYAEFSTVTILTLTASPVVVRACNAVYIATLVLPASWSAIPVTAAEGSRVLINDCNRTVSPPTPAVGALVTILKRLSTAGNFAGWAATISAAVSTVNRTGGAAGAIYVLTPATTTESTGVWMSPQPWAPALLAPGATGRRLVKFYVAVKGSISLGMHGYLQVFIESPMGATGTKTRMYCSSHDGFLSTDGVSTWNGDAAITNQYVITVPIQVDRNEDLKIRVHLAPYYVASTYYYFDPKLEVAAG